MIDWADLYTATAFCEVLGFDYLSHIMSPSIVNSNTALYWFNTSQWWDFNADIRRFSSIVCDDVWWSWTTWTGSIIINNINNNPWINKSIFDENTLVEIYKYEAIIMVLIILNTFFMRLFDKKPKPSWFL
ncbi:MAG: hypothetical protein GQ557_02165 [Mycoplasmataceae bacterium]|nr:hypothetical protein [Mycoplasmataceae bacterium]